jgi:hypothetical protein
MPVNIAVLSWSVLPPINPFIVGVVQQDRPFRVSQQFTNKRNAIAFFTHLRNPLSYLGDRARLGGKKKAFMPPLKIPNPRRQNPKLV